MAELRANPTRALWNIRRRWEQQLPLSRAEWMLLAQYVQFGCEEVGKDADLTTNESLAQLMEAFLSVRGLRIERGVELDRYYLGNFGVSDAAILSSRQIDADVVPKSSGRS